MKPDEPARVLVDTSAWIDALREDGDPEVRAKVRTVILDGVAAVCDMVLLELWNGARGDSESHFLKHLQNEIDCLETTPAVWQSSRDLARQCRGRGVTIPATDLLIAACAQVSGCSLLHNDHHFDLVAGDLRPPKAEET